MEKPKLTFKVFLQNLYLCKRDENFYRYKHLILRYKIIRDTNWLSVTSYEGREKRDLPFHEQAIRYFEYKNMVIQKRAQYIIIFLTIVLLIMTGLQIYLTFFKR